MASIARHYPGSCLLSGLFSSFGVLIFFIYFFFCSLSRTFLRASVFFSLYSLLQWYLQTLINYCISLVHVKPMFPVLDPHFKGLWYFAFSVPDDFTLFLQGHLLLLTSLFLLIDLHSCRHLHSKFQSILNASLFSLLLIYHQHL